MKIAGTLNYRGLQFFIAMSETKDATSWHLVSEYHRADAHVRFSGELPSFHRLDSIYAQTKKIPIDYVVESVHRVKSSGVTKVYNNAQVLDEVTKQVMSAQAYHFDVNDITVNESSEYGGLRRTKFEARDERMHLRYEKENNMFSHVYYKFEGIELNMTTDWNLRVPVTEVKKLLTELKKTGGALPQFADVKSVDFATLQNMLDLSWYIRDGQVLKDYRSITNIAEFELYVMDRIIDTLEEARKVGKKLIMSLDTETTGFCFYNLDPNNEELDRIVALQLSWEDNQSVAIFLDMEYFNNVPLDYVLARLRPFVEESEGSVTIERRRVTNQTLPTREEKSVFGKGLLRYDNEAPVEWEVVGTFTFDRNEVEIDGHNAPFDGRVLYHYGVAVIWCDDTLQMSFTLNPKIAKGSNKLKSLTRRVFGHETPELSDTLGKGNEDKYRYINDLDVATLYGCADTDYTRKLKFFFVDLMPPLLLKQYRIQDISLYPDLTRSEYMGMQSDEKLLHAQADITWDDLQQLREFMYRYVGIMVDVKNQRHEIEMQLQTGIITKDQATTMLSQIKPTPNARHVFEVKGNEIRKVLYKILEYPVLKWTSDGSDPNKKRQESVDKFAMAKLQDYKLSTPSKIMPRDLFSSDPVQKDLPDEDRLKLVDAEKFNSLQFPLAYVLAQYGNLWKEWTSYYKPIKEQSLEGKIFKNYSLARIETRRIMNPGQTMKGALKRLVRAYSDDYYLVDFDQSQVEYRIMASLSNHTAIITKMNDPEKDYHTETASDVHQVKAHEVSKDLRKGTKGISFGVPYGLGLPRMTANLHNGVVNEDTLEETSFMLAAYRKANKPIIDMLEKYRAQALKKVELSPQFQKFVRVLKEGEVDDGEPVPYGMVRGVLGFYRLFDLRDMTSGKRGKIERPAGNFPIQNFAAELFRIILRRFRDRCKKEGIASKIIWHMLIHDELLFSVHKSVHPFFIYKLLLEECVITFPGHTKYFIGINIGENWYDCKKDSNEAPMVFVDRIVKRWDAGEFREDNYQDDVKGYVLAHKQEYIKNRIHEVLTETTPPVGQEVIQPNLDNEPVNLQRILDNFSNYTVRAYVNDAYRPNKSVTKKTPDEEKWIACLESWLLDYYGEGKQMLLPDGSIKTVTRWNPEATEEDLDDLLLPVFSNNDEDEDAFDEGWDFDEVAVSGSEDDAHYVPVIIDEEEDEGKKFWSQFDQEKLSSGVDHRKGIVSLLVKAPPKYASFQVVNKRIYIKVTFAREATKVKKYLQPHVDSSGYKIVFDSPTSKEHWDTVSSSIDLVDLDEHIKSLNFGGISK